MQRTKIEYLTHTWNPLAMRCTRVSAGCANCWHLRMANRLGSNPVLSEEDRNGYNLGIPWLRDKELAAPLKLKKPAVIGVQFMGDLFNFSVTDEQIAAIFGVMAACPQHTFMVLTKRPDRMVEWLTYDLEDPNRTLPIECNHQMAEILYPDGRLRYAPDAVRYSAFSTWPLPNVWLGVSVENQAAADERVPLLLMVPAEKRFVSCEPLLGEVDLTNDSMVDGDYWWLTGENYGRDSDGAPFENEKGPGIDLVIAGAETGPGKRPMNLEWARSLRDQCAAADVPFFFKVDSAGNHELDGRIHEEMPDIGGKR